MRQLQAPLAWQLRVPRVEVPPTSLLDGTAFSINGSMGPIDVTLSPCPTRRAEDHFPPQSGNKSHISLLTPNHHDAILSSTRFGPQEQKVD